MWKEFKEFIARGNVINLAVGIIIGAAFTAIVTSLVNDIIMPLIGIITGGIDFSHLTIQVGSATLTYGLFIAALINFFIIAIVVFLIVKGVNTFTKKKEDEAPAPRTCPFCYSEIDEKATRCPHCTSELPTNQSREEVVLS